MRIGQKVSLWNLLCTKKITEWGGFIEIPYDLCTLIWTVLWSLNLNSSEISTHKESFNKNSVPQFFPGRTLFLYNNFLKQCSFVQWSYEQHSVFDGTKRALFWTNLNDFEQVWTKLNVFEQIWTSLNKFEQVWTSLS